MISQAAALPNHVLMPSIVYRTRWTFIVQSPFARQGDDNKAPSHSRGTVLCQFSAPSDRQFPVRTEVVVERHPAVGDVVLLPARRPLGESNLRLDDLLEERVRAQVLLGDLVVQFELLLEDRIRRLEEADLVLRLQRDVVLRIA